VVAENPIAINLPEPARACVGAAAGV